MNISQATSGHASTGSRHLPPRTVTQAVALPKKRSEHLELRELLEANLQALHALHAEHRRMIHTSLCATNAADLELRNELRAIATARAPWVHAMEETRALLYVALRELIVGENEAELSMHLPQQAPAMPQSTC
jgi:hypothetical protein